MDRVCIKGLEASAVIGDYDWEREIQQPLVIDIEMTFDCRAAGRSDDLSDALDYDHVAKYVTTFVERSQFRLLEALGEALAQELLGTFALARVDLSLYKPTAVKNAANVGIVICRHRNIR